MLTVLDSMRVKGTQDASVATATGERLNRLALPVYH